MTVALPFCFSRAWGKPSCRGIIRAAPEDFRVTEQLGFEPDGSGEHAWLRIRKTGDNTGWVADRLAKLAGVRPFDVGYAGRKDRHAVTEQWFSCYLPGRLDPDWSVLESDNIEVLTVTRHGRKLRKGAHESNRFLIRVRMSGVDDELETRLHCVRDKGFPNYFGEQRFGHDRRNLEYAEALFAGERVPRSKRDIYISAARAWMFNRVLSNRVDDGSWLGVDDNGRGKTGPMFGVERKAQTLQDDIPEGFESWGEGLKRLKVKASRRSLCIVPREFEWTFEDDGALVLEFTLPSGSYATSLLRELVLYEDGMSE
ncbi:MAG: tRNA pseudouridine(13) synthase TruD [Pseudomonadales bacterium]|nr:tRNA pseudouridine(13) synthase TruD [Pseudomonadales bacterium]